VDGVFSYGGEASPEPRALVCDDDIRVAISGDRYNTRVEPLTFGIKYVMIRALLLKHNVLVDDTHTSRRSIMRLLEIDRDAKFIFFNTNPHLCIQRAHKTEVPQLEPIIRRMYKNLMDLTAGEKEMDAIGTALPSVIHRMRRQIDEEVRVK
jgi:hypothetical protein